MILRTVNCMNSLLIVSYDNGTLYELPTLSIIRTYDDFILKSCAVNLSHISPFFCSDLSYTFFIGVELYMIQYSVCSRKYRKLYERDVCKQNLSLVEKRAR